MDVMKLISAFASLCVCGLLYADWPAASDLQWKDVNDDVMGGRSQGSTSELEGGLVRFAGIISLENNGGFASTRANNSKWELPGEGDILLKVRGDGRSYWMDLRTGQRQGAFSYRQSFDTVAGEVIEVRLPLNEFKAQAFGRRMWVAPPLRPESVESLGFTLYDKQDGPFRLDIIAIGFEEEGAVEVIEAISLLERSVQLGVPLYNNGSPEACAAVYETALNSFLVKGNQSLPAEQQQKLRAAMAELPEDADKRAWALRREIDRIFAVLSK